MNAVQLVGRLTKDPELRYAQTQSGGAAICRFTVAVERRFSKEGDSQKADFISCLSFNKTAEFVQKYFIKGQRIGLTGRIQTGSYQNQEGKTVYTTEVVCDGVEFVEPKKMPGPSPAAIANGFVNIPDSLDDADLPFN